MDQAIEFLTWVHDKAPALLGWGVAAMVWVYASKNSRAVLEDYQKLVQAYHVAVVENAKVTERLALLIAERTRARSQR